MATTQRIGEQAYAEIVLGEPGHIWELHDGLLREKPGMSWEHDSVMVRLARRFLEQLNEDELGLRISSGRVRRLPESCFVPDPVVFPAALADQFRGKPGTLPIVRDPLPLVVEIWSPSTGSYDVDSKLPEYQRRGDEEIWRIHPYERTLTAWRRQPDGAYVMTVHAGGLVRPATLPNVEVDLGALFAD